MFRNTLPRYEILSEDALEKLDRGWKRILTEVGIQFRDQHALDLLAAAGQKVEDDVVFLDPEFVLEQVAKAPSEFDMQARNPAHNVHIGGDHMVFAGAYGAPFVREGTIRRDATIEDFRNFLKLAQGFPTLDSAGGVIVEPNDLPLDSRHLDMIYALQTLTDKIYMGSVITGENAVDSIEMSSILFGGGKGAQAGRENIEQTPAMINIISCNSPLRWDDRMLNAMYVYAAAAQPVIITPFILLGAMSPVTVPAALAQQVAEAFSGIALTQLIRPGAPVVFGSFLSSIDMRTGSPTFGTPESVIGLLATGQIARRYKLPFRTGGTLATSQVTDAQAGYEAMMTMMPTFMAGTNFVMHTAGWLESGLVTSYEKFIIDMEIQQMLESAFTPLEIDEGTMAFDAHQEVGHGGHFLGAAHTMERFRTCFYMPMLSSSENFERWSRGGRHDATDRATKLYRERLAAYEPPPLDPAIGQELEEYVTRRRRELGD